MPENVPFPFIAQAMGCIALIIGVGIAALGISDACAALRQYRARSVASPDRKARVLRGLS